MNIGFDLDKVLIKDPPYISSKLIERLHKNPSDTTLFYRIPKKPEQWLRILSHYRVFRPLHRENIEFVKQLVEQNTNKHYLISGRYGFLENRTNRLIKKYQLDKLFNAMFFNYKNEQPHHFKDELIKKLHIDRYIDDDLDLLYYLAKRNPKTIFYWFNKKQSQQLKDNLFSIIHLQDIIHNNG